MNIDEIREKIANLFENISVIKEKLERAFQEENEETLDVLALEYNQKVEEKIDLLKEEKFKIEEELKKFEEQVKRYPLVPKEEIIDPEEEKKYISTLETLEAFEKALFEKQGDIDKIKSLITEANERKIVKQEQEKKEELIRREDEWNKRKETVIEDLLKQSSGEYVLLNAKKTWGVKNGYTDDPEVYKISRVVPKKFMDLKDDVFVPFMEIDEKDQTYEREFVPYDKCDLEIKQKIKEKELAIKTMLESDNTALDEPGSFFIQIFDDGGDKARLGRDLMYLNMTSSHQLTQCKIRATQRQLAQAGLLPEDLDWEWEPLKQFEKENRRKKGLTSKDIAKASKDKGIKKEEEKGVWGKLVDRIKGMFNERGE